MLASVGLRWILLAAVFALPLQAQQSADEQTAPAEIPEAAQTALVDAAKAFAEAVAREAAKGDETTAKKIYSEALARSLELAKESQRRVEAEKIQAEIAMLQNRLADLGIPTASDGSPTPAGPPDEAPSDESTLEFAPEFTGEDDRAAEGFAPRDAEESTTPRADRSAVVPLPEYYANDEWIKNRDAMVAELQLDAAPSLIEVDRVFNPNDDETRPLRTVMDCVAVNRPGASRWSCCTATVIADNVLLTAAHCVPCAPSQIYVGYDSNVPSTGALFAVQEVIPHPNYNRITKANDLAIIVLAEAIPGDIALPRPLATREQMENAQYFDVIGFGNTDGGTFGKKFRAPVAIVEKYAKELRAGGSGFDSCQGDSGGPLYLGTDAEDYVLAGVTSRGGSCGTGGIYVRIDAYREWIVEQIERYD